MSAPEPEASPQSVYRVTLPTFKKALSAYERQINAGVCLSAFQKDTLRISDTKLTVGDSILFRGTKFVYDPYGQTVVSERELVNGIIKLPDDVTETAAMVATITAGGGEPWGRAWMIQCAAGVLSIQETATLLSHAMSGAAYGVYDEVWGALGRHVEKNKVNDKESPYNQGMMGAVEFATTMLKHAYTSRKPKLVFQTFLSSTEKKS